MSKSEKTKSEIRYHRLWQYRQKALARSLHAKASKYSVATTRDLKSASASDAA